MSNLPVIDQLEQRFGRHEPQVQRRCRPSADPPGRSVSHVLDALVVVEQFERQRLAVLDQPSLRVAVLPAGFREQLQRQPAGRTAFFGLFGFS